MRYRIVGLLTFVIVLFDQLTKWVVQENIAYGTSIAVTKFFSFVHVQNRGAAFGFLNNPETTWQFWFFFITTIIAVIILLWILRCAKSNEVPLFYALGAILGGALGNFIDRVRLQAVVDFLDFHIDSWHWPAFNVADIAICCGAFLLFMHVFSTNPHKEKREKT